MSIFVCRDRKPLIIRKIFFWVIEGFSIKLTKNKLLRFNYWSILMYYYLLSQKGWSWLIFLDQSVALGDAIAPIATSVGQSEELKALSKLHRSLPEGNPAAISDILDNREKYIFFPDYQGFPVTADENGHRIWILHVKIQYIDIIFS